MKKLLIVLLAFLLSIGMVSAQTVQTYDTETENMYPTNLNFDGEGNLWIGSASGFDTVAAKVTAGMDWTYYDTLDLKISDLGDDEVYDIQVADNGTACFLTHYGISYMDAEGNVKMVSNSIGTYTKGFVVDGNTLYWTYDGTPMAVLYEFDLESESKTDDILDSDVGMTSGPSHLTVYEGARDSEDQLWLCTHWGVIYEDTEGEWHTLLDGLYPDNLVADPEGNIWVSYGSYPYNDTLVQYNSSGEVLAKYSSEDIPEIGLLNGITDLETDQNGDLWMTTDSLGIVHFNGTEYTLHNEIGEFDLKQNVEDLEINNGDLWLALYDPATVVKAGGLINQTAIDDNERGIVARPQKFELYQNYPNPFNPTTTISFNIKQAERIKLSIYNIQGELVKVIQDGYLNQGLHKFQWDARFNNGKRAPSGIYFYQLKSDNKMLTKKMMLIR